MLDEVQAVQRLIDKLPKDSQQRVEVVAQVLRDLLDADNPKRENELAFTLVVAERFG